MATGIVSTGFGSNFAPTPMQYEYVTRLQKNLVKAAVLRTYLPDFADKDTVPEKTGSTTIRYSLTPDADPTRVSVLTEGTAISTFQQLALGHIDVTLAGFGEAQRLSDIVTATEFINRMDLAKNVYAKDCALKADGVCADVLLQSLAQYNSATGAGLFPPYTEQNPTAFNFTAGLASNAVSGTLTANWTAPSGMYMTTFYASAGVPLQTQVVMFTNGSTAVSWQPGLVGAAIAGITVQGVGPYTAAGNTVGQEQMSGIASAARNANAQTDFATLQTAGTRSTYKIVEGDVIEGITRVRNNGGEVNAIVMPDVIWADFITDAGTGTSLNSVRAAINFAPEKLFRDTLGEYFGEKIVRSNYAIREQVYDVRLAKNAAPTSNNAVYSTMFLGKNSYATPTWKVEEAATDPTRPRWVLVAGADSGNPLAQFSSVGWKAYWNACVFRNDFIVQLRSLSTRFN